MCVCVRERERGVNCKQFVIYRIRPTDGYGFASVITNRYITYLDEKWFKLGIFGLLAFNYRK